MTKEPDRSSGRPDGEVSLVLRFRPPEAPHPGRPAPPGAVVLDMGVAIAVGAAIRLERRGTATWERAALVDRLARYAGAGDPAAALILRRLTRMP